MLRSWYSFLFWWFLWWLLYKSPGVLGAREEREYVHIKVHMPDIVRKPNHYHKAVHKHPHPRGTAHRQHGGFKKLPPPEMAYYSEDPRGVSGVMATPYLPGNINMLNAPNEDNSLMAAPNYGPALFGHDDISAPPAKSLASGVAGMMTSTGSQQLMQQLFTPEMMSAAMTAMTVAGAAGGAGGVGGGTGVDTNFNTLLPNAASADDFLAALQREYTNMYGATTAAAPLQQQLHPSRLKPRKRKKKFDDPSSKAKQMPASFYTPPKQIPTRRRPGQQQHNYIGHYKRAPPYTEQPNDFEYNNTPIYARPHEDDIINNNNNDGDNDNDEDDNDDNGDGNDDDDGIYDYEEAKSMGVYGQRYNSIMDSSTSSSGATALGGSGPLSYQEFMYSASQPQQLQQQQQARPTTPTRLQWPQPQAYATPGNDIIAPSATLGDLQPYYQPQQTVIDQQQHLRHNPQLPYHQPTDISSSPANVPLRATTTASSKQQQRYKKRKIRNKRKRNRVDF